MIDYRKKTKPVPGVIGGSNSFRIEGRAIFYVPSSGTYKFHVGSDDGARLTIDGQRIVNNWTWQWYKVVTGSMYLTAGDH